MQPREVTLFRKANRSEVLALKRQDGPAGADAPVVPGLVLPAAAGGNASYAPIDPHSIPKSGKSDDL